VAKIIINILPLQFYIRPPSPFKRELNSLPHVCTEPWKTAISAVHSVFCSTRFMYVPLGSAEARWSDCLLLERSQIEELEESANNERRDEPIHYFSLWCFQKTEQNDRHWITASLVWLIFLIISPCVCVYVCVCIVF
jgi:hypothetical protein